MLSGFELYSRWKRRLSRRWDPLPKITPVVLLPQLRHKSWNQLPWVPEDFFFLIDTEAALTQKKRREEKKKNLWSQEYATSFPCYKSVQHLNWATDWILPCPQGINNIIMALIGYIEQLHCVGLKNRFLRQIVSRSKTTHVNNGGRR